LFIINSICYNKIGSKPSKNSTIVISGEQWRRLVDANELQLDLEVSIVKRRVPFMKIREKSVNLLHKQKVAVEVAACSAHACARERVVGKLKDGGNQWMRWRPMSLKG
jgi:SH3-like domain-containing protein